MPIHRVAASYLIFILVLAGVAAIYWPGLHSVFMLDDYQNLKKLEDIRPGSWADDAWAYVASGVAGPLGRYFPLASFALQYQAWPSDPAAFKTVNLAVHLAVGFLLFVLWRITGACSGLPEARARALALVAAGVWLIHPVNVSTVLYVVQRMTQLAALFTVAGLVCYVHGRQLLSAGRSVGWAWTSGGIFLGTLLATASKETGLLLPLFALVLEVTLLRGMDKPRGWSIWMLVFLAAPLAAASGYLALRFESWLLPTYALRDFTPAERLLTQARVLADYLQVLVLPTPGALGLFRDDYVVSRGLLEPAATLPALLFVFGLIAAAIWLRRIAPPVSFGILWFFAGQALESTIIPLELYFQHRNYLPAAGLIYGLVMGASRFSGAVRTPAVRKGVLTAGTIWIAMLAAITVLEARLWGNPMAQAAAWAQERPGSIRAREWLGNTYAKAGKYAQAAATFRNLAEGELRHAPGYILWLKVTCYASEVEGPRIQQAAQALRVTGFSKAVLGSLEQIVIAREAGECDSLSHDTLTVLFTAVLENPELGPRMAPAVYGLLGRLQAADGRVRQAVASWDRSYAFQPSAETALLQAKLLVAHGYFDEGLAYLALARTAPVPVALRNLVMHRIDEAEREVRAAQRRRDRGEASCGPDSMDPKCPHA